MAAPTPCRARKQAVGRHPECRAIGAHYSTPGSGGAAGGLIERRANASPHGVGLVLAANTVVATDARLHANTHSDSKIHVKNRPARGGRRSPALLGRLSLMGHDPPPPTPRILSFTAPDPTPRF